jgi:hypothetical protein
VAKGLSIMTAMARRLARLLIALLLAGMLAAPAVAWSDGDPASDFLLAQNVFYPFQPPVAQSLQRTLNAETAATRRAGLPLKVAIIDSPADLGAIPTIFGKPQGYADFLDREISFNGPQPLLVVMPDGYGVAGLPPAVAAAVRTLRLPAGRTSDDLARAVVPAITRIAAAAGHPIPAADRTGGATSTRNSPWLIAVALAAAAVLAAAGLLALRRRRAARRGPRPRGAVRLRR